MGFLNTLLGIVGFGIGLPLGLLVGFLIFIYFEPTDVKVPAFVLAGAVGVRLAVVYLPLLPSAALFPIHVACDCPLGFSRWFLPVPRILRATICSEEIGWRALPRPRFVGVGLITVDYPSMFCSLCWIC